MLDFSLDRHDKNLLELKLNYGLARHETSHSVQAFVFVPRILALTKSSYPPARFYEDTATFIRMTTPKIPLEELVEVRCTAPASSAVTSGRLDHRGRGWTERGRAESQVTAFSECGQRFRTIDVSCPAPGCGESAEAAAVSRRSWRQDRPQRLRKVGKAVTTSTRPNSKTDGKRSMSTPHSSLRRPSPTLSPSVKQKKVHVSLRR